MYSIITAIVGVPITPQLSKFVCDLEEEGEGAEGLEWREWDELGFEEMYHGGTDYITGYCGVYLGQWDVIGDIVQLLADPLRLRIYDQDNPEEFEDVPLVPTDEQIAEANKMFEALHPAIRKRCPAVGVYLVESSS